MLRAMLVTMMKKGARLEALEELTGRYALFGHRLPGLCLGIVCTNL
jgi:hypothetical protein